MGYKIGIDVGGTFTDFLLCFEDGSSRIYKVLSTPDDPSEATMTGLGEMARDQELSLKDFLARTAVIVHGTTVTTNAVLTYTGAKTGLVSTKGVRDALEMRRGVREEQYNNRYRNVKPLVRRRLRRPVDERLDYAGKVLKPLPEDDVREAIRIFKEEGVEAVAVCLMNSFANPVHEQRIARIIAREMPDVYLSVSTEVLPSIRFYDRVSTTALNAYVGPILKRYLDALTAKLAAQKYDNVLLIMASNGGVVAPATAAAQAACTLLSGPAGGPVAGRMYAEGQGRADCLTVDMGGTSFDAALVKNGKPFVTTVGEVNRLRLALPMLNVVTIGAGGGSIGWIDEGGLLRMGPQSASSKPGPVCYGLGGTEPTCTDADLVLGYLDPNYFAGGKMKLDKEAAARAIEEKIAGPMGCGLTEAAAGMYDVINVNMAAAVREVAVNHGQDPRDFPMVTAGGAGPNHACRIALELDIPLLLCPRESSIFCAAGMLMSDLRHDFVRSYPTILTEADPDRFLSIFRELRAEGEKLLLAEGIAPERIEFVPALDLRYVRQYHEVTVEVPIEEIEALDFPAMVERFHPRHNRLYGYQLKDEGAPVELINMRLMAVGLTEKPRFFAQDYAGEDSSAAMKGERSVYIPTEQAYRPVPVYDAFSLKYGNQITGPAVLEQVNTTIFVTPEYSVLVDRFGSYTLYPPSIEDEVKRRILP